MDEIDASIVEKQSESIKNAINNVTDADVNRFVSALTEFVKAGGELSELEFKTPKFLMQLKETGDDGKEMITEWKESFTATGKEIVEMIEDQYSHLDLSKLKDA
mgnify:CR=1 FL=1